MVCLWTRKQSEYGRKVAYQFCPLWPHWNVHSSRTAVGILQMKGIRRVAARMSKPVTNCNYIVNKTVSWKEILYKQKIVIVEYFRSFSVFFKFFLSLFKIQTLIFIFFHKRFVYFQYNFCWKNILLKRNHQMIVSGFGGGKRWKGGCFLCSISVNGFFEGFVWKKQTGTVLWLQ